MACLKDACEDELAAHFNKVNHSKSFNTVLNCSAVATYVVSQFMPKERRLLKAKTHVHIHPSWNRHYFESLQKQKKSLSENYYSKKLDKLDYFLLQSYIAMHKIQPFTPLIIGLEMKTINNFGHDISGFVLPYDPQTKKAELVLFDAHGLIPKPWCKQRNFDKSYTTTSIDVFDCDQARKRVQAWMEATPAYEAWRQAQNEGVQDYFDESVFKTYSRPLSQV